MYNTLQIEEQKSDLLKLSSTKEGLNWIQAADTLHAFLQMALDGIFTDDVTVLTDSLHGNLLFNI